MVDLFATSSNHRCTPYFLPFYNPCARGTDTLFQDWDGLQVYAFPPCPQEASCVLRCSRDSGGSVLAPASVIPGSPGSSWGSASMSRSTQTASFSSSSSWDPQAVSSCRGLSSDSPGLNASVRELLLR